MGVVKNQQSQSNLTENYWEGKSAAYEVDTAELLIKRFVRASRLISSATYLPAPHLNHPVHGSPSTTRGFRRTTAWYP